MTRRTLTSAAEEHANLIEAVDELVDVDPLKLRDLAQSLVQEHQPQEDEEHGALVCGACSSWWSKAGGFIETVDWPCQPIVWTQNAVHR